MLLWINYCNVATHWWERQGSTADCWRWKLNRNAFDFLKTQMCNFRWPASAPRYFPTVMRRTLLQSTLSHSEENVSVCYLSSGAAWSGKQNPSIWERLWHFIGIFQNVLECLTFSNQMINQWHRFSHVFCVWNFKAQLLGDGGTGEGALFGHPKIAQSFKCTSLHLCDDHGDNNCWF